MNSLNNLILLLFTFLAGHGLFLSLVLVVRNQKNNSKLLGVLLLLLLIRVGKSVISLSIPKIAFFANLTGLVSMAALGPLILGYTKSLFHTPNQRSYKLAFHLIPAVIVAFIWSWELLNPAYYLITLQLLMYLIVTSAFLITNREVFRSDNIRWKWAVIITFSFFTLWITFALQLFAYDRLLYLIIVIVSIVLNYSLALWAFIQQKLFTNQKLRPEVETEERELIHTQIAQLMHEEIYIDSLLNLSNLAKRLNKPPYLVSRVINEQFNKTFPELLVYYRIRKAEELILSPLSKTLTVEGIAYESGFTTLSAFYAAFKKETGMTPTQFKKRNEGKNKLQRI